jgi:hypothetical protein
MMKAVEVGVLQETVGVHTGVNTREHAGTRNLMFSEFHNRNTD